MKCEEAQALLGRFAAGELDVETRDRTATHLDGCDDCRSLAEEMRVAAKLLREGVQAEIEPILSDERREALLARAASEWEEAGRRSRAWAFVRRQLVARPWLGVAAAYLVVATGVGVLLALTGPDEDEALDAASRPARAVVTSGLKQMGLALEMYARETRAAPGKPVAAAEETEGKPRAPSWAKLARQEFGEKELRRALDTRVTFEFVETPLSEAISSLQNLTKLNIVLDPEAAQDGGAEVPVTLRVTNMELRLALDWVLKLADLDYALRDGAIFVSTPENCSEDVVLRMYDIRDLTASVSAFPGPQFALSFGGQEQESRSEIVVGSVTEGGGESELTLTSSSLAEIIQDRVKPDSWAAELGTSVEERGGKLVVMQRPEVHAKIGQILESLREAKKNKVVVQARFIEVDKDFLRDLGIEFEDLPDKGAAENVLKEYDIRDLAGVISGFPGPKVVIDAEISGAAYDPIFLTETIRNNVEPDSWAAGLGTSIEDRNGKLVVIQTPEVHARVGRKLAELRAQRKELAGSGVPLVSDLPVIGTLFGEDFGDPARQGKRTAETGEAAESAGDLADNETLHVIGAVHTGDVALGLFREGKELFEQNRFAEAREKLLDALRLDPTEKEARRMTEEAGPRLMIKMMAEPEMGRAPRKFWDLYRTAMQGEFIRGTGAAPSEPKGDQMGLALAAADRSMKEADDLRDKGLSTEAARLYADAAKSYSLAREMSGPLHRWKLSEDLKGTRARRAQEGLTRAFERFAEQQRASRKEPGKAGGESEPAAKTEEPTVASVGRSMKEADELRAKGRSTEAARLYADAAEAGRQLFAEEKERARQRAEAARFHHKVGKKFLSSAQYEQARDELRKALALDPENEAAQELLREAERQLGFGPASVKTAAELFDGRHIVGLQSQMMELQNLLQSGKEDIRKASAPNGKQEAVLTRGQLLANSLRSTNSAVRKFEQALEVMRWMPHKTDLKEHHDEARKLLAEAQAARKAKQDEIRTHKRALAASEIEERRAQNTESQKKKLAELGQLADAAFGERDYDKAEKLALEILRTDPIDERAQKLLLSARELRLRDRQREMRITREHEMTSLYDKLDSAGIPFSVDMVYPDDWEEISKAETAGDEPQWKKDIQKQLERKVSFEFVDTPLNEAVDFLQTLTRIPMVQDPKAAEGGGASVPITLRATNMELRLALKWILRLEGLDYTLKDEAIHISTPENLAAEKGRGEAGPRERRAGEKEIARRRKRERVDADRELDELRGQIAQVKKEKARLEKDIAHEAWVIQSLLDNNVPCNEIVYGGAIRPAPPIKTKVLGVEDDVDLVLIGAGKKNGVKPGYQFIVYRGDKYIGKVEIEKVLPKMSSARILRERMAKGEAIREGDVTSTKVYGGETPTKRGEDATGKKDVPILPQAIVEEKPPEGSREERTEEYKGDDERSRLMRELAGLKKGTTRLEKDLAHEAWVIQTMVDSGIPVREIVYGSSLQPTSPVKTKVMGVNDEVGLVLIGAGSNDGVKPGHQFIVYRGDKYIGKVQVEKVLPGMASARILPDRLAKGERMRKGDEACTKMLPALANDRDEGSRKDLSRSPRMIAAQKLIEGEGEEAPAQGGEEEAPAFIELSPEEAEAQAPAPQPEEPAEEEPAPEENEPEAEAEPPAEEPPAQAPPVNPFVLTARDPLSTFAMDVDTASYAIARSHIRRGALPPARAVRMEEFINAFDYNYPHNPREVFSVHAEAAPAPFGKGLTLLKVGVRARDLGRDARKPAHLVFVVDASGSMDEPDRLPLVKHALRLLAGGLGPDDMVSLVTYGTEARLLLEAVPASRGEDILAAVDAIRCGGSTNLLAGLRLGYEMAQRHFRAGAINRVVLCSDGVANVGPSEAGEVLQNVSGFREWGVTLTCAGFGEGSYDDAILERLADSGDGNYVFIDSAREARRAFVEEMAATLQVVAADAKIQVELNPARVRRYRLIGYENRDVPDERFRDDAVDAGEVGSGQSVTALYELELAESAGDVGTVHVRYRNVETGKVEEIAHRLMADVTKPWTPATAPRLFLAAAAAEFAEILRGSEHARDGDLSAVERVLEEVASSLPLDARAKELLSLVRAARGLREAGRSSGRASP